MSRLAVIWEKKKEQLSGMAKDLADGARGNGARVDFFDSEDFDVGVLAGYDAVAFGFESDCVCAGARLFSLLLESFSHLSGKKVALFGICHGKRSAFAENLMKVGRLAKCQMVGSAVCESPTAETPECCRKLGALTVYSGEPCPHLAGTVAIVFSTITGNAYKLAAAVSEVVPDHVGPYNIRYINDEVLEKFDTFVLSYWCNHGTADDDTIELIRRMHGKKLIVIGTLGVARDTAHAAKVCENVEALASGDNVLLGHFLCRGSIDLRRTAARMRIPEGQKGHLSAERFEKQKQSLGHPDENELAQAQDAVRAFLKKA